MRKYEIKEFLPGYDDSLTEELTAPNATQTSKNVSFTQERGAVKKDYGYKVVSSTGLFAPLAGAVQGMYEGSIWASGSGGFVNKRVVVAGGTAYWYCPGNFFTKIGDGSEFNTTAEDYVDVVHYIDDFIMSDGSSSNNIKKWNGLNLDLDNLAGATGTYRGKRLAVFENRLMMGNVYEVGDTWYGNRIRWSNLGDPETWDAADNADVVDKIGDEIVRLFPLTDNLVIFKRNSVHSMTFTGGDIPFTVRPIDEKSINNAPWSVARGKGGLYYLNEEGIFVTDGASDPQLLPADMKVNNILKRLFVGNIHKAYATSLDTQHKYYLALPIDGSETCNYIIVYDWKHDVWEVIEKATNVMGVFTNEFAGTFKPFADYYGYELAALSWDSSLLYGGSKELYYGLSDGTVDKRSIGYNDNSAAYDSYHETPWLDFGEPDKYKEITKIEPTWKGIAGDYADIQYKTDYGAAWTSCTVDAFDESGEIEQPPIFLRDVGKKWKFRISNNNADEYFTLYKMIFYYNLMGER